MYFKKAIVLGVLAAVTAAPSALARLAPIEPEGPGQSIPVRTTGSHPKVKPQQCVRFGPYCFSRGY